MQASFFFILLFLSLPLYGKNHICLTMIVKNESHIIERLLNSTKDIVDCISISDTGSTDNTVELIENFMKEKGIPGRVYHDKWKSFGHNRTVSVMESRKTLTELQLDPEKTYFLLLDADMILKRLDSFNKEELIADAYMVMQKSPNLSHYNTRLIKASLPWCCLGVTHEYWYCPLKQSTQRLATLEIEDRGDGGSKADKFERDLALLTKGIQDEPENERYLFYLAQTYKCLKQYEPAIEWYKKRVEKGGWVEEVWYSKYMIGECYELLGSWEEALKWYLAAYECNPARSESLYPIAKHYRINKEHALATLYARQGASIPIPRDQLLFISDPIYDYQFDEELSIAAYYTPFKKEGYQSLNRLLLNKKVPEDVKKLAYSNLRFYVEPLPHAQFQAIEIKLPPIEEGSILHYLPMNPSILRTTEGYDLICRTVNYTQEGASIFKMIDPNAPEVYKTKNFLIQYDKNFNLISQKEIIEDLSRKKYPWRPVEGLEDCRIFMLNGKTWFSSSCDDISPNHQVQIVLCKLSREDLKVEKLLPLSGPISQRCEKNWLPFIFKDELHLVYGYSPFLIYKPNLESGICEIAFSNDSEFDLSHFRGSAAPIPFDDGYLMMVHEVGAYDNRRYYYHRFLKLDNELNVKKLSKPFVFKNNGVEYCLSMTLDHLENELIIPIGVEDREAYLCKIKIEHVRELLE